MIRWIEFGCAAVIMMSGCGALAFPSSTAATWNRRTPLRVRRKETDTGSSARADAINRSLRGMDALQADGMLASDPALARLLAASGALLVGPSKVPGAGSGLFFTGLHKEDPCAVEAGTILTFCACHGIGFTSGDDSLSSMGQFPDTRSGEEDSGAYVLNLIGGRPLFATPSGNPVDFGEGSYLSINVNPKLPHVAGWLGHMINDGACIVPGQGTSSEGAIMNYYEASGRARNIVFVPFGPAPLVALVATGTIQPGSELLTSYGCEYWLDDDDEPEITPKIQACARELAMDILTAAKQAALGYRSEITVLAAIFAAGRDGTTPAATGFVRAPLTEKRAKTNKKRKKK